jgi:hypothetical protein
VPFEQQQLAALDAGHCVELAPGEAETLATRIRSELLGSDPSF